MKLIIDPDTSNELFHNNQPTVAEILGHKLISHMLKGFKVIGVYRNEINATDMNSIVIKVIPSSKGSGRNGK